MDELTQLQEREHTFSIKGKVLGKDVQGEFTCRYPSILDEIEVAKKANQILDGADLSTLHQVVVDQAYNLAYCDVLLKETPDWFDISTIDNTDVLNDIVKEMVDFFGSFRKEDEENQPAKTSDEGGPKEDL